MLEARFPLYQAAAQITVDTTHRDLAQVVELVLAAVKTVEAGKSWQVIPLDVCFG